MRPYTELKKMFHEGWDHPAWVGISMHGTVEKEFVPGTRHDAWLQILTRALATDRRQRILDVGAGPGVFACCYAELGHECTGMDFAEAMVTSARERAAELSLECDFVHGDAEDLPFPDESFDVVSSRHVLYTLPRPGVALRHWVRVLKSGGKLILIAEDLHNRRPRQPPASGDDPNQAGKDNGDTIFAEDHSPGPEYYRALHECPLVKHHTYVEVLWALLETAGLEHLDAFPADEVYDARVALLPDDADTTDVRMPHVVTGIKP